MEYILRLKGNVAGTFQARLYGIIFPGNVKHSSQSTLIKKLRRKDNTGNIEFVDLKYVT
jgi:hypothetical protein